MSITPQIAVDDISAISICIGVDIGKQSHVAAFVSASLLKANKRYEQCPTLSVVNSRQGFEQLLTAMRFHGALINCAVLVERTGHYGNALIEYLQEQGIAIYAIQATKRISRIKTDKRDAQGLALMLYNQVALGIQVADEATSARRMLPPTATAALLRCLVRHRYELSTEEVRRRNKLTAICDELFPEFTQIFKDVNGPTALDVRAAYPTPAAIVKASLDELLLSRRARFPGNAAFVQLRTLAAHSIGNKEPGRVRGLCIEQSQLIVELRLIQANIAALDTEITMVIMGSREGQILLSLPAIGPISAAEIIAAIGTIANFETPGRLRAYFGWSPDQRQSGTSLDKMPLTRGGSRPLKKAMYLIAWNAVQQDTEWKALYERLVPRVCQWDERRQVFRGKNKVLGRVAGQIIGMIYVFLKRDYDLLISLEDGEEAPPPPLYDRAVHRAHRSR